MQFKGIDPEIHGEAPFIGARLLAPSCSQNCPQCHNQHLKELPDMYLATDRVLRRVAYNPLHQGIILGGLEWLDSPVDLIEVIKLALDLDLQVMLYTGRTYEEALKTMPEIATLPIWLKHGAYDPTKAAHQYYSWGVSLATTNQSINYLGRKTSPCFECTNQGPGCARGCKEKRDYNWYTKGLAYAKSQAFDSNNDVMGVLNRRSK